MTFNNVGRSAIRHECGGYRLCSSWVADSKPTSYQLGPSRRLRRGFRGRCPRLHHIWFPALFHCNAIFWCSSTSWVHPQQTTNGVN